MAFCGDVRALMTEDAPRREAMKRAAGDQDQLLHKGIRDSYKRRSAGRAGGVTLERCAPGPAGPGRPRGLVDHDGVGRGSGVWEG